MTSISFILERFSGSSFRGNSYCRPARISSLLSLTKVERKQKEKSAKPLIHGQIRLDAWSQAHSLSECEKEVVDILVAHFNQTGTPFLYPSQDQLSNQDPKTLQTALQRLRQEGIIYLIRDPTLQSWKLGLKKDFIQKLRYLQSTQDLRGEADT